MKRQMVTIMLLSAATALGGCAKSPDMKTTDSTPVQEAEQAETAQSDESTGEDSENVADDSSDIDTSSLEVNRTIEIDPTDYSKFNDTNDDGYGEFQGFGTSLCWWANRVGYSEKLTNATAKAFFSEDGLGWKIGRYNIGGGDNVAEDGEVFDADNVDFNTPHKAHIRRSDSVVPGYAVDVTPIDLEEHDFEYYEENFDRAFDDCGYAWNYDWDADPNQMNVLKAAMAEAGEGFIAEAFSNSPPYFMTVSGCSSGAFNAAEDNIREDSTEAFAAYITDVIEHWANEGVVSFQSVTPMNEPTTSYWQAYSEKQEGCHISSGDMQSDVYLELGDKIAEKGLDIVVSGTDETSIDSAIQAYNSLSDDAKAIISRIDTHSYTGSERKQLRQLAESEGKNLWMSEVDGDFVAGKKAGDMASALGLSKWMKTDLNQLLPSAWIMWDAIDTHIDSGNEFDWHSRQECLDSLNLADGNSLWGIAIADHDAEEIILTKKYYALGQYSRYIKPGYCLIGSGDFTVCAYDPKENKLVIVATSNAPSDEYWEFDLSGFEKSGESLTAIRTSGAFEDGENWADVTDSVSVTFDEASKTMKAVMKGQSITTFIIDGVVMK